jgi:hypothetical protein
MKFNRNIIESAHKNGDLFYDLLELGRIIMNFHFFTVFSEFLFFFFFYSFTVHLDIIESVIYPIYAPLECFKILKFTLKFT